MRREVVSIEGVSAVRIKGSTYYLAESEERGECGLLLIRTRGEFLVRTGENPVNPNRVE